MAQANIMRSDPREASLVRMERHLSTELKPSARSIRSIIEHSAAAKVILKIIGVLGVSLIMAVSRISAVSSRRNINH